MRHAGSAMNILLIKTTSLGDVLHATPHIRAIRECYPEAHLTVLTAKGSAQIYAHHPAVDRLVLFDHARFKELGLGEPRAALALIGETLEQLNDREYELAFDLQGLARTVVFLYRVRARRKFVKGRWPGLGGFRNKQLHAIDEMSAVLAQADIPVSDSAMAFYRLPEVLTSLCEKLASLELTDLLESSEYGPYIVISPFTRWVSKNWPLERFIQAAERLSQERVVLITGTEGDRAAIAARMPSDISNLYNLAGMLSLPELAELMSRAGLVISGDSFPMHLAAAVQVPQLALFGPTDEAKTGPRSENSRVLRPDDCAMCDKPDCRRACLEQIPVARVTSAALSMLRGEPAVGAIQ